MGEVMTLFFFPLSDLLTYQVICIEYVGSKYYKSTTRGILLAFILSLS